MIEIPLQLRKTSIKHNIDAWIIPFQENSQLLDYLSLSDTEIYLIPRNLKDNSPAFIFVITENQDSIPKNSIPYRRQTSSIYIPADTDIFPHCTQGELTSLLSFHKSLIHPSIGIIGFDKSDLLKPWEAILPPKVTMKVWRAPAEGAPLIPGIKEIQEEKKSNKKLKDNISSKKLSQINAKEENELSKKFNSAASKLFNHNPQPLPQEKDEDERQDELNKLVEMMENDPDSGLKFAIPLENKKTRGEADPQNKLKEKTPEFDSENLSNAPPGDSWNIADDMYWELQHQYRKAANRELALKRYKRAAYIYAELLGEFDPAANALLRGEYYDEAADIYLHQLKNKSKAAECYEKGNLLDKAAKIYIDLKMWVKVGDLYSKLNNKPKAERFYQKAVDEMVSKRDYLEAGLITNEKLDNQQAALDILKQAWPNSEQAAVCLKTQFSIIRKTEKHHLAEKLIMDSMQNINPQQKETLAEVLINVCQKYSDNKIQTIASNKSTDLIGEVLQNASKEKSTRLIKLLMTRSPEDQLFIRDCNKYLSEIVRHSQVKTSKAVSSKVKKTAEFNLSEDINFQSSINLGREAVIAGSSSGTIVLLRINWQGRYQRMDLPSKGTSPIICPGSNRKDLWIYDKDLTLSNSFKINSDFSSRININSMEKISASISSVDSNSYEIVTMEVNNGKITCNYYSQNGSLLKSNLVQNKAVSPNSRIFLIARTAFIQTENSVIAKNDKGIENIINTPSRIKLLIPDRKNDDKLLVVMEMGLAVILMKNQIPEFKMIDPEINNPVAGFSSDGDIIQAQKSVATIYRSVDDYKNIYDRFEVPDSIPTTVLPAETQNSFCIINKDGSTNLYIIE